MEHDIKGSPSLGCYGCQGTGRIVGFSASGQECPCSHRCEVHDRTCWPDE